MMTDEQQHQLKGYAQAVREMTDLIDRNRHQYSTLQMIALENLESSMREKVVRLIEVRDND